MPVTATTMSRADYARHRGVVPQKVGWWRSRGMLVHLADGSIDVAASDAALAAAGEDPPPPIGHGDHGDESADEISPASSRAEAERVKAIWAARRVRTVVLRTLGELVPVADVRRQAFLVARITRDRLLALPARVVDRALACDERRTLVALLEEEIRLALEELVLASERIGQSELGPAVAAVDDPDDEDDDE